MNPDDGVILDTSAVDVSNLGPLLARFVELIGIDATMRIVERFGGAPLYIAAEPRSDGPLAVLIGWPAARDLGSEFAGEHPTIPKAYGALQALRNRRLRDDRREGRSLRQLALRYGLTQRRICQILAADDPSEPDPNGSLFD